MSTDQFVQQFTEYIKTTGLIEPGDKVLAAVSGGADSVALLFLLHRARDKSDFELSLFHLNHKLRGKDADIDEKYVRKLAEQLKIPACFETVDIKARQTETRGSIEEVARNVRYELYQKTAERFHSNKVALAHHRDDQCETILYNIARGTGLAGIRGMPQSRPVGPESSIEIIRPLLGFTKSQLVEFLEDNNIEWCEDHTNYLPASKRNVIRNQIIPQFEQINSNFRRHLLSLADQARECEKMLNAKSQQILSALRPEKTGCSIETGRLNMLPVFDAKQAIRNLLLGRGIPAGDLTQDHIESVLKIVCREKGAVDLPANYRASIDRTRLYVESQRQQKDQDETVELQNEQVTFDDLTLAKTEKQFTQKWFDEFLKTRGPLQEAIDRDCLSGSLKVRYARDGEKFTPLGAPGSKTAGDFLTDRKVPLHKRPPVVVADDKGIVWVAGYGIADRVKVTQETETVLILSAKKSNAELQ